MKESKFEISKVYTIGGKNIGILKSKFVTKTQFLCNLLNFKWPSIYRCLCPIYTSTHKSCVRSVLLNPRALTNLTLLDEIKRWVQTREILQPVHRADYSLISPTFPSFVLSPSRPTLLPSPPLQPFPHSSSLPPVLHSFPPLLSNLSLICPLSLPPPLLPSPPSLEYVLN